MKLRVLVRKYGYTVMGIGMGLLVWICRNGYAWIRVQVEVYRNGYGGMDTDMQVCVCMYRYGCAGLLSAGAS